MSDEASPPYTGTEAPGTPASNAGSQPNTGGDFRLDIALIAIVIIGAIIVSNVWLRRRSEKERSE